MLTKLFESMFEIPPWARRASYKTFHAFMSILDRTAAMTVLNYGYAGMDGGQDEWETTVDHPDRFGLQLYLHVAGQVEIRGLDVIEVGCGRGGGAGFVHRELAPRSYVGVDQAKSCIKFCNRTYSGDGIRFIAGRAEALPFGDSAADAVLNIESSGNYVDPGVFLDEVTRVLRPGGHLLWADIRATPRKAEVEELFANSDLDVIEFRDITANVIRAIDLDQERRNDEISRKVPGPLRGFFRDIAAVKGTRRYELFVSGQLSYFSAHLCKQEGS